MAAEESEPEDESATASGELRRVSMTSGRVESPATVSAYSPGVIIGDKYRLVRLLGEGAMGTVWVGINEALDAEVAIKLIRGDNTHPELSERLLREARVAARLRHPSIVRVFDYGVTFRRDPYIVMELLDGEDMATTLSRRGRLSPKHAIQIMLPVLHGLGEAHAKGVVHRDLKPENVFLMRVDEGRLQPKLVDFGIAKFESKGFERVTQAGTILGSPAYLSPQQALGEDVDERADIWAAAVVLYEMMTGVPPFEGKNYHALVNAIIGKDVTPTTSRLVGDGELWEILSRGLAKEVADRWQRARDFGEALARWLVAHNVHEDITGASLQATWLRPSSRTGDILDSDEESADVIVESRVSRELSETARALPELDAEVTEVDSPAVSAISASGASAIPTTPPARRRQHRMLVPAIGVAVVVVVGLWLALSRKPTERVASPSEASPLVTSPGTRLPVPGAAVASPEGAEPGKTEGARSAAAQAQPSAGEARGAANPTSAPSALAGSRAPRVPASGKAVRKQSKQPEGASTNDLKLDF